MSLRTLLNRSHATASPVRWRSRGFCLIVVMVMPLSSADMPECMQQRHTAVSSWASPCPSGWTCWKSKLCTLNGDTGLPEMERLDGRGRGRGRFADVIFLRALLAISLRTAYGDKLDTGALRDHAHVRTEAMAPKSPGKYEYYTVPGSW